MHTPGPWTAIKVNPASGDWGHRVFADRDLDLTVQMPDPDEEIANARLIAAAPDLLTSCKALKAELDALRWGRAYPGRPHAIMDAAEAAIAKAEGRS